MMRLSIYFFKVLAAILIKKNRLPSAHFYFRTDPSVYQRFLYRILIV